jgi:hypothetical protein
MPDGSLGPVIKEPCSTTGLGHQRGVAGLSRLEAARRAVERARQALVDLEDEARGAGAPPGWIR